MQLVHAEFNAEQTEWLQNPNFTYRPKSHADRWEYFGNNNWVKEGMDKINHQQNHSISVGGGEQKLNYLVSGSYYKRDGVLRFGPDDNSRYNFKSTSMQNSTSYVSCKVNSRIYRFITCVKIHLVQNRSSTGCIAAVHRQSLYTPAEDITGQQIQWRPAGKRSGH